MAGRIATFIVPAKGGRVQVELTNHVTDIELPETLPPYGPVETPEPEVTPTPEPIITIPPITVPPYDPVETPTPAPVVTESPTEAPPDEIAKTGETLPLIMIIGLFVIALGAAFLVLRKRHYTNHD